ncbi:MAG TPA: nitrate/sulfonate/bicarbonate ABC transporter ATP-binding protein [Gemmatimonadaceae bacterium]|jgi:NitT/TauT family transport system ATP-binding protein|nr:nitrate/sulfonate/bicarbonate ABC transporter ATP-binding protein [Gemmatimonadaceae bacterium]
MSEADTITTMPPMETMPLLAARDVMKYFGDDRRPVLEHVSVELNEGEFVALLGPSGSGKSTLLRILAGLMEPSSGEVLVHGSPLEGTNPNVAIVFQSFALFPWLDVLQNVELGLLAMEVPEEERRMRATKAIDLIGLDGFEEAFPKELSGGMKQRVGFARALVVQPEVLFMDEPFSALDVLTAENLRTELQDLWLAKTMPTKAVVMVTHNIDEAVSLADRILVFGANPGHIRVELKGLSPADRTAKSAPRARLVELIYRIMTNPEDDAVAIVEQSLQGRTRPIAPRGAARAAATRARRYQVLPDVSIDDLTGLVQYIGGIGGHAAVQDLSRDLQMRADDLLAIVEATDLLGFGALQERQVVLTPIGTRFADAETDEEKAIFRAQALDHIALLHHIVRDLETAPTHTLDAERVIDELEHSFSSEEARRQFETAVDWGRYAELFTYDDSSGELTLDEEHRARRS